MDTSITEHFNIPPTSLPIISVAFLIIIVPFYDRICVLDHYTLAAHWSWPNTFLHLHGHCNNHRKRKGVARDKNMLEALPVKQPLPLSIFWLSFQYFVFSISDMFTYVGLLEFFYSESPKGVKSTSTCFLWCFMASSGALWPLAIF